MRTLVRLGMSLCVLLSLSARAQSGVGVELDEVVDNRMSAGGYSGGLELRVKLKGTGLDKAIAARVIVKEAKDDRGTVLADGSKGNPPDFFPREYNMGTLQVGLLPPVRSASSVRVKGTLELFVPSRDPNAIVKIDKALTKLDTPFSNKTLKAAKLEITPLSREGYAAARKERKLDEKELAAIRAEGKARGVPEKEVEVMIGLAQALEMTDEDLPEGAVMLSGKKSDFDRIYRVEILGEDGKPIDITGRTTSTRGESSLMMLQPAQPAPANAALQLQLITAKSRMAVPFELTVPLP